MGTEKEWIKRKHFCMEYKVQFCSGMDKYKGWNNEAKINLMDTKILNVGKEMKYTQAIENL